MWTIRLYLLQYLLLVRNRFVHYKSQSQLIIMTLVLGSSAFVRTDDCLPPPLVLVAVHRRSVIFFLSFFLFLTVQWHACCSFSTYTCIKDVHNMAGPLVPYNHASPKRVLIHRDRESSVIRPLLYLQATTAGSSFVCVKLELPLLSCF